ncbi:MAG TPA: helix-turn-helix transcriptional regulator [Alicyclobacillus sp.]|nr:helix-turn-helix transcriptional regulator [Alicyclobacillus sp.]
MPPSRIFPGRQVREIEQNIRETISRRVRELRLQKGMSVEELARAAGVSASYVYAVEAGTRGSRGEELYRVAKALGVGIGELVE